MEGSTEMSSEGSMGYATYDAMKPSDIEWLGEIPAHWKLRRLKATVRRCQNGLWGDEPNGRDDYICVRVADFDRLRFGVDISEPTYRSFENRVAEDRALTRGDLLLEKSGGGEQQPVGVVALYDHDEPALCSNFIARMQVAGGNDPRFLSYLHAALYAARVNTRSINQSTGIQNLDSSHYLNARVALPTHDEQTRIAAFLDRETAKIDALVANKRRLIELLQEERAARIMRAVTMGLDADASTRRTDVPWLPRVPARWKVEKLGWHTDCLDGRRIPLNAEERAPMRGDYPYWGANSIVDYVDKWLFDEDLVLLGEDGAPFFDRTRPVAFHVRGRIWVNNHAHVLRARESLDPGFLAHVLNCVEYRTFIDGSTRDKLTQGDMNRIPIQIPPLAEQMQIRSSLDEGNSRIDSVLTRIGEGIERLNELRASLISAAVTGKIDVRGEVA